MSLKNLELDRFLIFNLFSTQCITLSPFPTTYGQRVQWRGSDRDPTMKNDRASRNNRLNAIAWSRYRYRTIASSCCRTWNNCVIGIASLHYIDAESRWCEANIDYMPRFRFHNIALSWFHRNLCNQDKVMLFTNEHRTIAVKIVRQFDDDEAMLRWRWNNGQQTFHFFRESIIVEL